MNQIETTQEETFTSDERPSGTRAVLEARCALDAWAELAQGARCVVVFDGATLSLASVGAIGSASCEH